METETKQRNSFTSSIGFVLAAAGSAVGLGNIWRFPYLAAKDGGGLFLVVYLALAIRFCTSYYRSCNRTQDTGKPAYSLFKNQQEMGFSRNLLFCSTIHHLPILLRNRRLGNEVHVLLPFISGTGCSSRRILRRLYHITVAADFLYSAFCCSLFHYCLQGS